MEMTINTVKYIAEIETPTVNTGYLVNGTRSTTIGSGDRYEVGVDEWMAENIGTEEVPEYRVPEEAYTQAQLDQYIINDAKSTMDAQVNAITVDYIPANDTVSYTFSGSYQSQNEMTAHMQVLFGKADTVTRNYFTVDKQKVKLSRDDFDNLLDMIEPIFETITDI